VLERFGPKDDPISYLDRAEANGLKVLAWFSGSYALKTVTPAALDPWVAKVKSHPALYGYVSVIEPGAVTAMLTLADLRVLYQHLKSLDPGHPVVVSYGHLPWFGDATNDFGRGVADSIITEWYPVVFPSPAYPAGWVTTGPAILRNVRSVVAARAPGTPIWVSVQMHEYLHSNKRQPSFTEVIKMIDQGFDEMGARGVLYYPWHTSSNYTNDLSRNPELQESVRVSIAWLRAGHFNR
jgi:hypothetical protein